MFWEAIEVSLVSNAQIVCLAAAGSLAVRVGLIDRPKSKDLSRLAVTLLNPALKFSMFPVYSLERIGRWSPVMAVSIAHTLVGAGMGALASSLCRLGTPHRQLLIMCSALGNVIALPFVLVVPVVSGWRLVRDQPGAAKEAYGIISLYILPVALAAFSIVRQYIETLPPQDGALDARPRPPRSRRETCRDMLASLRDPTVIALLLGVAIGCIEPLRRLLDEGALRFVGRSATSLGECAVTLMTVSLGASLHLSLSRADPSLPPREPPTPVAPSAAASVELAEADTEAASMSSVAETLTAGAPAVDPATADVAGPQRQSGHRGRRGSSNDKAQLLDHRIPSSSSVLKPPAADGAPTLRRARRTFMCCAILIRLVLMPALLMPLHLLCVRLGGLPCEPLVLVVLHLQSAVPSGMVIVPLLAASGRTLLAEEVSALFLPQYLLATFTVSAALVAALMSTEAVVTAAAATSEMGWNGTFTVVA